MPVTKSAEKALRQSIQRKKRNSQKKESYKNIIKEVRQLAIAGKKEEVLKNLPKAYKILDKVAKSGFIKKNKASRLKSRLAKLANKK